MRNWCVGLCLGDNAHEFRVFDDHNEAVRFRGAILGAGVYNGVPVRKVYLWEM